MLVAVDTNVLVYAEAEDDRPDPRTALAIDLLALITEQHRLVVPAQVLGELTWVFERKQRLPRKRAAAMARQWMTQAKIGPTSESVMVDAFCLTIDHGLTIWDAIVVAASAAAKCEILLTEDLHDGFVWRGCTVANPFAAVRHPLLVSLLP